MDMILLESVAFKELTDKLDTIYTQVCRLQKQISPANIDQIRIDTQEMSDCLNISERTIQRLRNDGFLPYTVIRGRCIYRVIDICTLMENKTIPCSLDELYRFKRQFGLN